MTTRHLLQRFSVISKPILKLSPMPRTQIVSVHFRQFSEDVFKNKEQAEESIWIRNLEKEIREEEKMKKQRAAAAAAKAKQAATENGSCAVKQTDKQAADSNPPTL